jgi:hypothetical protein
MSLIILAVAFLIANLRAQAQLPGTKVKILRIAQLPQVNLRQNLSFEEICIGTFILCNFHIF